jgi:uncharacterized membrane protein YfcA
MNPFPKKFFSFFLPVISLSLLAGVVGGLFGTGGGILIVFLFSRVCKDSDEFDRKDLFAMTVLTVSIMSLSSLFSYMKNGAVTISDITPTLFPAVIGGILGAFLLDKIKAGWLNRIFALLVIYAGITLIFR